MYENIRIAPQAYSALLHKKSENDILDYIRNALLEQYGQAPSVVELGNFFNGKANCEFPGSNSEQMWFAVEKAFEFQERKCRRLSERMFCMDVGESDDEE